jgi:hypothetical protein
MGSEASYLLATLVEGGGTYRTTFPTFRVEILTSKFKKIKKIWKVADYTYGQKYFSKKPKIRNINLLEYRKSNTQQYFN